MSKKEDFEGKEISGGRPTTERLEVRERPADREYSWLLPEGYNQILRQHMETMFHTAANLRTEEKLKIMAWMRKETLLEVAKMIESGILTPGFAMAQELRELAK